MSAAPGAPQAAAIGGITDHTAHLQGALVVLRTAGRKVPPTPYSRCAHSRSGEASGVRLFRSQHRHRIHTRSSSRWYVARDRRGC